MTKKYYHMIFSPVYSTINDDLLYRNTFISYIYNIFLTYRSDKNSENIGIEFVKFYFPRFFIFFPKN